METDAKFNIPSVLMSITFSILAISALPRAQSEHLSSTGERRFLALKYSPGAVQTVAAPPEAGGEVPLVTHVLETGPAT